MTALSADDLDLVDEIHDDKDTGYADTMRELVASGEFTIPRDDADTDDAPEPAPETEGADRANLRETIRETIDDARANDPTTWDRERRRLADEALRRWGVDPSERHQKGVSRRSVERRLFAAEESLVQAPAPTIGRIARDYGAARSLAERQQMVVEVARGVGIIPPEPPAPHLVEARARELAAEAHQFRQAAPHFDAVRPTMHQLVLAGRAGTLSDAYRLACEHHGIAPQGKPAPARQGGKSKPGAKATLRSDLKNTYRTLSGAA